MEYPIETKCYHNMQQSDLELLQRQFYSCDTKHTLDLDHYDFERLADMSQVDVAFFQTTDTTDQAFAPLAEHLRQLEGFDDYKIIIFNVEVPKGISWAFLESVDKLLDTLPETIEAIWGMSYSEDGKLHFNLAIAK